MIKRNFDNDKLAICIVSEFPPPPGGIGQQARLLSDHLENEGFLIYEAPTNIYLKSRLSKFQKVRYVKSIVALYCYIKKLIYVVPKVNIVHILANSYLNFFLFTTPAIFLGKLLQKKVVVHYHGGAADTFLKRWESFIRIPLHMADQLIVPSKYLQCIFNRYGYNPVVVPNIANLSLFRFKQKNMLLPKLFIARHLEPLYNVECAIKAFALVRTHYPDAILTIAGSGSQENFLKQLSEMLDCSKGVFFIGRIANDEMAKCYHEANIVINTSNVDNMPVSIIEAFASGCPVVSTRAGGIPFLIESYVTGILVELNDHIGIADGVRWLIENPEKAIEIAETARQEVNMFSWDEIHKKLIALYRVKEIVP